MGDAQFFQQAVAVLVDLAPVALVQLQHRHDVLFDRHAAEDRRFLRQVADAEAGALVHRLAGDVLAVEQDGAVVGLDQAGDHVEAGRLAGAVGSQETHDLAARQLQADALDHGAVLVGLADAVDHDAVDDGGGRAVEGVVFGAHDRFASLSRSLGLVLWLVPDVSSSWRVREPARARARRRTAAAFPWPSGRWRHPDR